MIGSLNILESTHSNKVNDPAFSILKFCLAAAKKVAEKMKTTQRAAKKHKVEVLVNKFQKLAKKRKCASKFGFYYLEDKSKIVFNLIVLRNSLFINGNSFKHNKTL